MRKLAFIIFALIISSLFLVNVSISDFPPDPEGEYSPWGDLNDDGNIDLFDIVWIAGRYGTTGTPMNKTELVGLEDRVAALETRLPKKGYISVPPAAFVPFDSNWQVLTTNYLANYEATIVICMGAVQLPHGATVTNITVYWRDVGTQAVTIKLRRHNLTHWNEMAYIESVGDSGFGSSFDDTIDYETIDNSKYYYYMEVGIPPSVTHLDYQYYYAVIETEYAA